MECSLLLVKSCCNLGGDINVGEHVLDVVEIFESIKDPVKLAGVLKLDTLGEVWLERHLSGVVINTGTLDGFTDINNSARIRNNLKDLALINDVLRLSVDGCLHELVLIHLTGLCLAALLNLVGLRDRDNTLALEQTLHRTAVSHGSAVAGNGHADVRNGAIAIVSQALDEDGDTAGGVALVGDVLPVGTTGLGAGNPENQESIFAVLAGPVLGPLAFVMSLAILTSSASSLQSTMVGPARTLLSMGFYRALPESFGRVSPRFKSPSVATFVSGAAAGVFYVVTRLLSENALWDTITALGMMVCFYYGITAVACVWFFRREALESVRSFVLKLLCPLVGGVVLLAMFLKTAVDSMDPSYGSGSSIGGVGMVFVLGVSIIGIGLLLMAYQAWRRPEFFRRGIPAPAAEGR